MAWAQGGGNGEGRREEDEGNRTRKSRAIEEPRVCETELVK